MNKKPDKEILTLIDSIVSRKVKNKPKMPEPLLKITATAKDLYKSGLPEWIEHVDEYKHNYGKSAPYDVAIIKSPSPEMIDEKGYYKKRESFGDHPNLAAVDASFWEKNNQTPSMFFTGQLIRTKYCISLFLFRKSLLKAVSEVTGINFCDQVDRWYEEIKDDLQMYEDLLSRALTLSDGARESFSGVPDTINLDEIQINEELEKKFRERISQPLESEKWVADCMLPFHKELIKKSENGVFT